MKKIDKNIYEKQIKRKVKTRKKMSVLKLLFFLSFFIIFFILVLKNTDNIKNIFTKKNKIKTPQEYTADDLQIGDIVYYNHKDVIKLKSQDPRQQEKYDKMQKDYESNQTVTIPVGNSATPGSGDYNKGSQTFNVKNLNTTWRVWDKLPDGRIMLISNRGVEVYLRGAIGYIWWEHTAQKISSIFGYGEGADVDIIDTVQEIGANKGFSYKVGSGIDDAPDMTEGDKGIWKIGEEPQDKINISGARSLTFTEVEKKLGITPDKIKRGFEAIRTGGDDYEIPYGMVKTNTTMSYVVQRDVESLKQKWGEEEGDRKKGKAKNQSYTMTDKSYSWDKYFITEETVPNIKYKDILFDYRFTLASTSLNVDQRGKRVFFSGDKVTNQEVRTGKRDFTFSAGVRFNEDFITNIIRPAVFLKPNIKYLPLGNNAWDIYQARSSENKELKLKVLNLSSNLVDNINIEINKIDIAGINPEDVAVKLIDKKEINGKIEYRIKVKKFDGQKRDKNTIGNYATFSKIDNKYNVAITGIPEGYDFKIIGKAGKQIDLDTDTNLEYELVIYPKAGTQNIPVEYIGGAKDKSFAVTGHVLIKSGDEALGRKNNVTLKRGLNSVSVDNVDLFDKTKNIVKDYKVEFEKSADDTSLHTVEFDTETKKLVVTYVSPKREIMISVAEDSKKYLTNITEIKLKFVGGEEKNITLKPNDYTFKLTVPETDEDGNLINYSLQKVENIQGYYVSIDGFNVNLKPILKLPYTGTEFSGKNIAIISLGIFGIALAIRFRKKLVLIFKEYTMMK